MRVPTRSIACKRVRQNSNSNIVNSNKHQHHEVWNKLMQTFNLILFNEWKSTKQTYSCEFEHGVNSEMLRLMVFEMPQRLWFKMPKVKNGLYWGNGPNVFNRKCAIRCTDIIWSSQFSFMNIDKGTKILLKSFKEELEFGMQNLCAHWCTVKENNDSNRQSLCICTPNTIHCIFYSNVLTFVSFSFARTECRCQLGRDFIFSIGFNPQQFRHSPNELWIPLRERFSYKTFRNRWAWSNSF